MRPASPYPQAIPSRRESSRGRTEQDYKTWVSWRGMSKGRRAVSKKVDPGQQVRQQGKIDKGASGSSEWR
jgi:hypothetical protein